VCRRALRVSNATNLIFPNEKMALKDGLEVPAHQQAFATALFNLLYGDDDLKPRFEGYADMLEGVGAAKWTIATYFLLIVYPEAYVFLKPTVTQHAGDISGFEIHYRPDLNWRTYASVLGFANYLKTELVELSPRDMIDVQSYYVVHRARQGINAHVSSSQRHEADGATRVADVWPFGCMVTTLRPSHDTG
jgi:hypothetical protein